MKMNVKFETTEQVFKVGFSQRGKTFSTSVKDVIDLTDGQKEIAYQDGYTEGHTEGHADGYARGEQDGFEKGYAAGGERDLLAERLNGMLKTYISDSVVAVPEYAFRASTLETVELPNCKNVGTAAFQNSQSLKTVRFPNCPTFGGTVLRGCSQLVNVELPELTNTSTFAFADCIRLEKITLPKINILSGALFSGCTALKTLVLSNSNAISTLSNTNVFTDTPIEAGDGYIYVPKQLLESYKKANQWTTYAAQIRAIEDYPEIAGNGA